MLYYLYHINNKDSLYFYLISSCFAGGSKRWTFSETVDIRDFTVDLYYPLCVSRRIDTWHIVYLSNKDPCPKILVQKMGSMDSDGTCANSQPVAS